MYLVATGSRLGAASPHVGVMVGPRVRGLAPLAEGRWWASDNDGFTGHFQAAAFLAHLERLGPFAARCLFVAAPDVVGDAAATLALFPRWRSVIESHDFPVAVVAQDGQEALALPESANWLFLAGSDAWRGRHGPALIAQAGALGYWGVHVGRVNSARRVQACVRHEVLRGFLLTPGREVDHPGVTPHVHQVIPVQQADILSEHGEHDPHQEVRGRDGRRSPGGQGLRDLPDLRGGVLRDPFTQLARVESTRVTERGAQHLQGREVPADGRVPLNVVEGDPQGTGAAAGEVRVDLDDVQIRHDQQRRVVQFPRVQQRLLQRLPEALAVPLVLRDEVTAPEDVREPGLAGTGLLDVLLERVVVRVAGVGGAALAEQGAQVAPVLLVRSAFGEARREVPPLDREFLGLHQRAVCVRQGWPGGARATGRA